MANKIKLPDLTKMSRRERMMAVVGAAIVFVVLADRLAISPWWNYIKKIRKETKTFEEGLNQQKKLLSRKESILSEVDDLKTYLKPGGSPEMEMASFLREVEAIGKRSQLSLQEVKPLPTNSNELYQEYGLEAHYEGTLEQCVNFIYSVENGPGLFTIEKALMGTTQENPTLLKGYFRVRRTIMQPLELGVKP